MNMYKLDPSYLQQSSTAHLNNPFDENQEEDITEEMVLSYTDCKKILDVQVISLRAKGLARGFNILSQCQNMQIAFLSYNRFGAFQDLNQMQKMQNLVKLNLSNNNIVLLPAYHALLQMKNLRMLFLDHNQIQNWSNLESLTALSDSLYHLTLSNNPISQVSGYRHYLVTKLIELRALDDFIITDEERMEDVGFGLRFRALSPFMRLYIPEFKEDLNAEQHLFQVDLEVYKLKRLYEKNSPSIRIQALFKGYKQRVAHQKYFEKRQKSIIYIQKMIRGWLQRLRMKRELRFLMRLQGLEYLTMSNQELMYYEARKKLEKPFKAYIQKRRRQKLEIKMAIKIQTYYRQFREREYSYIKALLLEKYPVIYFLREQRSKFRDMIELTCKNLKQQYVFQDIHQNFVSQGSEFQSLRYPDFTEFPYKTLTIVHNLFPSIQTKVQMIQEQKLFPKTCRSLKYNMCQYGSDKDKNIQRLNKLKTRNCGVDIPRMKKIIKERNTNYDSYQDFDSFFFPNINFAKALIKTIKLHNMNSKDKQILLFFKYPLLRVQAAIKIQTGFRHYLWRKNDNQFKLIQRIIEHRASLCLQSKWKYLKLTRRFRFLVNLKVYLEKIDSPTIYLEEQIYLQLPTILEKIQTRSTKFVDQFIRYYFDLSTHQIIVQNYKNPRFEMSLVPNWVFDHKNEFQRQVTGGDIQKQISLVGNGGVLGQSITLKQTLNNLNFDPMSITMSDFSNAIPMSVKMRDTVDVYENEIMALIHFTDSNQESVIKDYNQIANFNSKSIDLKKGLKFIEINCSTVLEAKKRSLTIALLTFLLKHQTFIKVFTQKQIEEGFFLGKLRDLWEAYGFEFSAKDAIYMSNRTFDTTYKQQIKGIELIISKKDSEKLTSVIEKDQHMHKQEFSLNNGRVVEIYSTSSNLLRKKRSILTIDNSEGNLSNVEQYSVYQQSLRNIDSTGNLNFQDSIKKQKQYAPFKKVIIKPKQGVIQQSQSHQVSPVRTSNIASLKADIEKKLYEMSIMKNEADFLSTKDLTQRLQFAREIELESKKQEVSNIREFKDYMKNMQQTLQKNQLNQFLQFKKEQKDLVGNIIERERERKFFENFNKKLNVMNLKQESERKKEQVNFSKNLGAQINMLNKVSLNAFKRKEQRDQVKDQQKELTAFKSRHHSTDQHNTTSIIKKVDLSESLANYFDFNESHMAKSTQVSPRDNLYKPLISYGLDSKHSRMPPLVQTSKNQILQQYQDELLDSSRLRQGDEYPNDTSIKQYSSLIRQYERNKIVTRKPRTQIGGVAHSQQQQVQQQNSNKEIMVLNESVQLPAFPKKNTRNAFERSYHRKRQIQVQMMGSYGNNQSNYLNNSTFNMNTMNSVNTSIKEQSLLMGLNLNNIKLSTNSNNELILQHQQLNDLNSTATNKELRKVLNEKIDSGVNSSGIDDQKYQEQRQSSIIENTAGRFNSNMKTTIGLTRDRNGATQDQSNHQLDSSPQNRDISTSNRDLALNYNNYDDSNQASNLNLLAKNPKLNLENFEQDSDAALEENINQSIRSLLILSQEKQLLTPRTNQMQQDQSVQWQSVRQNSMHWENTSKQFPQNNEINSLGNSKQIENNEANEISSNGNPLSGGGSQKRRKQIIPLKEALIQ